jgi:8-oxo-dGTP pyrophosphatase MutT (NUDIX family)
MAMKKGLSRFQRLDDSGQICFPGGAVEPGESDAATAFSRSGEFRLARARASRHPLRLSPFRLGRAPHLGRDVQNPRRIRSVLREAEAI